MRPPNRARLITPLLLAMGLSSNAYSDSYFHDEDYQRQQSQADKGFDELDQTDDEGVWVKPAPPPQAKPPQQEKVIVIIKEVQQPRPAPPAAPAPQAAPAPAPVVEVKPQPPAPPARANITKTGAGIAFELDGCLKAGNEMECRFNITSQYFDRTVRFGNHGRRIAMLYDNLGNEYKFYKVKVGNKESLNPYRFDTSLVADTTVPATFYFSNISTQATSIAKLELNSTANKSGRWENFTLKYRKFPFSEQ